MAISVFKHTKDDWYPSYKVVDSSYTLVEVSIVEVEGKFIVNAWGHDDCGLERVYTDRKSAQDMFNTIISWDYVNMKDLRENGFKGA